MRWERNGRWFLMLLWSLHTHSTHVQVFTPPSHIHPMSFTWQRFLWFEFVSQRLTCLNTGSLVSDTSGESVEPLGGEFFVGGSGSLKMGLETLQPGTISCRCLLPGCWCNVSSQPAALASTCPLPGWTVSPRTVSQDTPFHPSLAFAGMVFTAARK